MKRIATAIFLLYIFTIGGCKKTDDNPFDGVSTGSISGKITDINLGSALANVSVTTTPATSTVLTNSAGEFVISDVQSGSYILKAGKTGYLDYTVNVSVAVGKTTQADMQLSSNNPNIPTVPSLVQPANGATWQPATLLFTWTASTGVGSYTLQVSSNSNFSTLVYNQGGLSGTSQQVSGLANSAVYYWRVRAVNTYGSSAYSEVRNFTTSATGAPGYPCPGVATVNYAGKTYHTVLIGSQCWLKENLNVGVKIKASANQVNDTIIQKYCYADLDTNCDILGGYYQWNEAMQYVTTPGAQGICPAGWHIPTQAEFETLIEAVGQNSNSLKAIGQGDGEEFGAGTDSSGFSGLLNGIRGVQGTFGDKSLWAYLWSSSNTSVYGPTALSFSFVGSTITIQGAYSKTAGINIRCLKN
ncbi:MAG: carboxypeptidase regulatory-like domain-containing protein [Ignavibacteria bacterium]|nr:carboxypeptidase regulatory-like domain-containing protein [Ignavibacteria bacterium]